MLSIALLATAEPDDWRKDQVAPIVAGDQGFQKQNLRFDLSWGGLVVVSKSSSGHLKLQ